MKDLIIMGLLLVLPGLLVVNAQEKVYITLEDAVDMAVKNNSEVRTAAMDGDIATAIYRQTNAVFLPQIRLSYSGVSTNHPLYAFGFKLQQQSIGASDFNPDELNNPSATQNFGALAEWEQPLINIDQVYKRKAARKQLEAATMQKTRTAEYITFKVREAYHQLQMAYQQKQVVEEGLTLAQALLSATQQRFEKGFLQQSDVLNARVHVLQAESSLADAGTQIANASDQLGLLMNASRTTLYEVDLMDAAAIASPATESTTVPDARADLQAMTSALSSQEDMIRSEKNLPRLNAFAQYSLNDADPLGFGSTAYMVGARLSWDLFTGMSKRNQMLSEEVKHRKMEEELRQYRAESEFDLTRTKRKLNDLTITANQRKTAVDHATESLRILQDRYAQGLVSTTDLLNGQNQLQQQKLYYSQILFEQHLTIAYLEFLTSENQ